MVATSTVWTPYLTATLNGVQIDPATVQSGRVETSFADPVSKGYVKCFPAPLWGQGDDLTITLGGGANNLTRFTGSVYEGDYLNSGPTFELVARGPFYAAQKFRNNRPNGYTLYDLTGGPATDEAIAMAVLDIVGLSYDPDNIGGTGIVRGASAPDGYTWRKGETALEYLQRLTKASLGYKMIESLDGLLYRVQIYGRPYGVSDYTFTEGIDIFEGGHTQRETFDQFVAWEVTGFDYGDGLGAVRFADPDPLPNGVVPYAYSSEMIERIDVADSRSGISCEEVMGYVQAESDHEIVKLSGLQTPRDELFGPGQTFGILSGMLGVTEPCRLIGATAECDDQWFTHTFEVLGGGTPPVDGYVGPP